TLANSTTYYWHVKARDAAGNETGYTPAWSFTTECFPPVRINGPITRYYSSLQAAYDDPATTDGDIIQTRELTFTEDLMFNSDKSVTLKGGFNCDYTFITGATTLNGTMTINIGSIIIDSGILVLQ
ncbi:MAG: hypothetical protein JSW20_14335, partial [Nitrospiraceae bacterium]